MAKYKLMASFGYAGDDTDFGVYESESEEDAAKEAYEQAAQRIDAWAELVEDEE